MKSSLIIYVYMLSSNATSFVSKNGDIKYYHDLIYFIVLMISQIICSIVFYIVF